MTFPTTHITPKIISFFENGEKRMHSYGMQGCVWVAFSTDRSIPNGMQKTETNANHSRREYLSVEKM
jgi:hypothetical protein